MTRPGFRRGRGAEGSEGGSPGGDPPIRRVLVPSAVAAGAGLGLLLPMGHDVQFSPVLAWFLAAINLAIIVGAIAWLLGRRGAHRPANPAPAPAPPGPNPAPESDATTEPPSTAPRSAARPSNPNEEILARLQDPDPFLRMSAVAAMRGRRDCEEILVRTLNDRYPMVRREVVRALRTTGSSYATQILIKVAGHDPSAEVREEAVAALGALVREGTPEQRSR